MAHDRYARIINAAMTTPWAITPEKAMVIRDILQFRAAGGRLSAEEIRARVGAAADEEKPRPRQSGLVAVIPVWGVIAHRTFDASSGMTSCDTISAWVKRAANDDEVSAVILDCSTPGGTASGVPELAAEIAAANKVKPVYGIANAEAYSAGYWLLSQCTEVSVIPSGGVGSVGVFMISEDWSEYLAKEGIKIDFIHAGEHKFEGARFWEPMTDETRAHYQAQVDRIYADFLKAVARGRGVTVAQVKKTFGQGRCFSAAEALERGMVDRVETFDQLLARISGGSKRRGGARAETEEAPRMTLASSSTTASPETGTFTVTGGKVAGEDGIAREMTAEEIAAINGATRTTAGEPAPEQSESAPVTAAVAEPAVEPAAPAEAEQAAIDRDELELARAR
jgi:capsid assembly protease